MPADLITQNQRLIVENQQLLLLIDQLTIRSGLFHEELRRRCQPAETVAILARVDVAEAQVAQRAEVAAA